MNTVIRIITGTLVAVLFTVTFPAAHVFAGNGVTSTAVVSPQSAVEEYATTVRAEKVLVTTTAGNGQRHTYLATDKPEVTAITVEIPPGAETGWHLHTVPVYAYVLSGTLTVEIADGKTLTFRKGEAIVEVQNLAHNGRNSGTETVRLAVFYTGEEGRPNVTKILVPGAAVQ